MSQANLCGTVPRLSLRSDSIYQYNQPAHEFRGRAVFGYGNVVYVRLNLPNSLCRHSSANFDKLSKRKPAVWLPLMHHRFIHISMQISFEHNFLFVHIPKTGGTSVRSALKPYQTDAASAFPNALLRRFGVNVNHYLGNYRSFQFRIHERIKTGARRLPPNVFDAMFKFCFVRNPWDLLVSNYCYVKSNKKHKRYRRTSSMNFAEFIEFAVAKEIGFQKPIVSNTSGDLLVDQVGKFETLTEDFQSIVSKLQIEATLPHLNRVTRPDYRQYYDRGLIARVADCYRDDIEAFEYEFDGSHSNVELSCSVA